MQVGSKRSLSKIHWHRAVYQRIRSEVTPVRPSQYDIANACNLRCEGCLFFAGSDYLGHPEERDPERLDAFFAREARRGVNFAQFGGAEPALAVDTLRIAARHIRRGVVFTNGTVRLPADVPYRLHVSLWGLPGSSAAVRGAEVVEKALRNYRGDRRAVFVFTIHAQNLETLPDVVQMCADNGVSLSFSHFSPTTDYRMFLLGGSDEREFFRMRNANALTLDAKQLARSEALIARAMQEAPDIVIYSAAFSRWIHRPGSLFSIDPATGIATDCGSRVTKRYRHFHADLTDAGEVKCCAPNLDCSNCRIYAQSLSSALGRGRSVFADENQFTLWVEMWDLWCRLFLVGWQTMPPAGRESLTKAAEANRGALEEELRAS